MSAGRLTRPEVVVIGGEARRGLQVASLGGEADIEVWDDEVGGWRQVGHFGTLLIAQLAVEAAFQTGEHVRTGGWLYEAPDFLKNPDDIGMWWAPGTWREADEVLYVPLEANAVPVQDVPARPDAEETP